MTSGTVSVSMSAGLTKGLKKTGPTPGLISTCGNRYSCFCFYSCSHLHPQGLGYDQDVREDDGGVQGEPPDGLEGELTGQLRSLADLEEVVLDPELSELWEIAASLRGNVPVLVWLVRATSD